MGYHIDLESISIDQYKKRLESGYLPPSRMILKEKIDERLDYFKSIGINNVKELIRVLKKKDKIEELSKLDNLSGDYLKILLRELNSTLPKPNKISEFSGISKEIPLKLAKIGIKNTKNLYDKVITKVDREELAKTTGINKIEVLELTKLTDLSRIKWAGVNFARMLYDIGFDTVEKTSKADPVDLHKRINEINKEKGIYKGHIGLNDIRIFVDAANEVPQEIEY